MKPVFVRTASVVIVLLGTPCGTGCLAPLEGDDESVGVAAQEVESSNALASNALASNALTSNALASNALLSSALTSSALTSSALVTGALVDANARAVLKYIVSCALPAGQHIEVVVNGTTYGYDGGVGVAKGWGDAGGHCDSTCAKWVSGCVLSRVNYLGVAVPLSLRGSLITLSSTTAERTAYPNREATYYGDIFQSPQIRYACLSPGATSDSRVCGPSLLGCVMTVVGACDRACDSLQGDGSFSNCRDALRDASNKFPPGAVNYPGTVTVFLQ
jgi:hypothetical protein